MERVCIDLGARRGYPRVVKVRVALLVALAAAAIPLTTLPAETVRLSPGKGTLQAALDAAGDGDTLILTAGTYSSPSGLTLTDKANLTIRGEGDVRILCTDLYQNVITISGGANLRIEGITARHAQPLKLYECEGSVISAQGVKGLTISRCELAGSGSIGVDLANCEEVEVSGSYLHDNTFAAFSLTDVSSITIAGNTIMKNAATIYSAAVNGLTMVGNVISDNGSRRQSP